MARARMPHQMRIDTLPDPLLLRALFEPRAHAVRRQRLAAAAAHERIGFGWRIELAQRRERAERLRTDGHDARLRALAGYAQQAVARVEIAPAHAAELGNTQPARIQKLE